MAGLGKTLASLSQHQRDWVQLFKAAGQAASGFPSQLSRTSLREIVDFGSNPGRLRMLSYAPKGLKEGSPLVVVLHGCLQTASGYGEGAGWLALADRYGFAVLLPEQQRGNNSHACFNWFQPQNFKRDSGEAASIRSMVDHMLRMDRLDPSKVFVTGLSAGGAMASIMLATYPDVFAGGAIVAGLPYGCASDISEALRCMSQGCVLPAQEWGNRVRSASSHAGPWPRVSVWQGMQDETVNPVNAGEIVKQWVLVHGAAIQPDIQDKVDGYSHRIWRDASGRDVVEEYAIEGMDHGTPLALMSGDNRYGATGPYLIEAGISSSYHIARFWGLTENALAAEPSVVPDVLDRPAEASEKTGVDFNTMMTRTLKRAGLI